MKTVYPLITLFTAALVAAAPTAFVDPAGADTTDFATRDTAAVQGENYFTKRAVEIRDAVADALMPRDHNVQAKAKEAKQDAQAAKAKKNKGKNNNNNAAAAAANATAAAAAAANGTDAAAAAQAAKAKGKKGKGKKSKGKANAGANANANATAAAANSTGNAGKGKGKANANNGNNDANAAQSGIQGILDGLLNGQGLNLGGLRKRQVRRSVNLWEAEVMRDAAVAA